MAGLLEIREYLKGIYSRYDIYLESIFKFVLAVATLVLIDMNIGYEGRLQKPALILIAGLLCSFLPSGVMVVLAAVFCLIHVFALSLECAVVVFAVFLLMLLVFFRFSPSDSLVVLLTPICFALHIPYVVPICCGLAGNPFSAISSCCGVVVYFVLEYIKVNESAIRGLEEETTVQKFRYIVDGILGNKSMVVMLGVFAVTVILVYLIRRLSKDHAWTVAMFTGFFASMVLVLLGDMALGVNFKVAEVIIGALVSLLLAAILKFFLFSVDYTRAESLQFEDDEYYYYVRAIPKMTVAVTEKKVKHINQRKEFPGREPSGREPLGRESSVRESSGRESSGRESSGEEEKRKSAKDYPVFNNARLDDEVYLSRTSEPRQRADSRTASSESASRYSGKSALTRDTADLTYGESGSRQSSGAVMGSATPLGSGSAGTTRQPVTAGERQSLSGADSAGAFPGMGRATAGSESSTRPGGSVSGIRPDASGGRPSQSMGYGRGQGVPGGYQGSRPVSPSRPSPASGGARSSNGINYGRPGDANPARIYRSSSLPGSAAGDDAERIAAQRMRRNRDTKGY